MAVTLNRLQVLVQAFGDRLENSPQTVSQLFDMLFLDIDTLRNNALLTDSNKYLAFRQTENDIIQIQKLVEEKEIQAITEIAGSSEFKKLSTTRSFLLEKQQELFPYYFTAELQKILDTHNKVDTTRLRAAMDTVIANNQNSEEKTLSIQSIVAAYTGRETQSLGLGLLFEFDGYKKVLKVNLQNKLDALTPEIERLYKPLAPTNKI